MLAALHAQVVNGECLGGGEECAAAASAVLPARLAQPALPAPAVRLHHLALRGTDPHSAMQRALTLASSWPLTRATIFDVMVSDDLKSVSPKLFYAIKISKICMLLYIMFNIKK